MDSYMHHEMNSKKLAQSPKSYNRGNLSEFTEEEARKADAAKTAHGLEKGSLAQQNSSVSVSVAHKHDASVIAVVSATAPPGVLSAHKARKESLGC
jgi:hypothetical protein